MEPRTFIDETMIRSPFEKNRWNKNPPRPVPPPTIDVEKKQFFFKRFSWWLYFFFVVVCNLFSFPFFATRGFLEWFCRADRKLSGMAIDIDV